MSREYKGTLIQDELKQQIYAKVSEWKSAQFVQGVEFGIEQTVKIMSQGGGFSEFEYRAKMMQMQTEYNILKKEKERLAEVLYDYEELKDAKVEEDVFVKIIDAWKGYWSNQTSNNQADFDNYFHRAFCVDANMKYHLAGKIHNKFIEIVAVLDKFKLKLQEENTQLKERNVELERDLNSQIELANDGISVTGKLQREVELLKKFRIYANKFVAKYIGEGNYENSNGRLFEQFCEDTAKISKGEEVIL